MQHHAETEPTASSLQTRRGFPRRARPSWSSCPTVSISTCGSLRSPSDWATRRSGCWPTTGRFPGPTLKVREGSEVIVDVENQGDMDATVHWHGLRLENRYDGTHETQRADGGGREVLRPRRVPGSGAVLVPPAHPRGLRAGDGPVRQRARRAGRPGLLAARAPRGLVLTLDDILLEDGKVAPFSRAETTYAAMGRFGDVLLVGGEPDLSLTAQLGEVVRLYLTNTANTRVFKVEAAGRADEARRRRQRPRRARAVRRRRDPRSVRASRRRCPVRPRRRAHAGAPHPGSGLSAGRDHRQRRSGRAAAAEQFAVLRTNPDMAAERERVAPYLDAEPRQDDRVHRRDGHGCARRRRAGRLHLPDAPGGRQRASRATARSAR